jgi:acyl-CoA reductase-like NAD-dependent aldehyde dehydrogenase
VGSLKVGDGTEADVFFGPVQNNMQYDKAKNLFGSLSKEGLTTALHGNIQDSAGYFIHPTMSITLRSHPG